MTNMDPVMQPIFTKTISCPGVGILKMIPCSVARPRTEKYVSTPPGPGDFPDEKYETKSSRGQSVNRLGTKRFTSERPASNLGNGCQSFG